MISRFLRGYEEIYFPAIDSKRGLALVGPWSVEGFFQSGDDDICNVITSNSFFKF